MDQVVCIRDDWEPLPGLSRYPKIGGIYTIREVVRLIMADGEVLYYAFEEIPHTARMAPIFYVEWFRPVRHTSIDVFHKMLQPTPEPVS